MRGTVVHPGPWAGEVLGDDGRRYKVTTKSFWGSGRQFRLELGDVVSFEPGGADGRTACKLEATPFCRQPHPRSRWGPLLWRDRVKCSLGGYWFPEPSSAEEQWAAVGSKRAQRR